jgi:hypothetical protein
VKLTGPYSKANFEQIATTLGVELDSSVMLALIDRANWYIAAQEFVANDTNSKQLRAEMRAFAKMGDKSLMRASKLSGEISRLSASARLQIGAISPLQINAAAFIESLADATNQAKMLVNGNRGRSINTIRDDFLIRLSEIFENATGKELKVRTRFTDQPNPSDSVTFLVAATEGLPGFVNMTTGGIEKAMERALSGRHK